jgi:tRNA(fMet)-specific endonuclease VapC
MPGRFPNGRRFLLDTNIVIAILNRDHSITRQITPDMNVCVPAIALGEAFLGAHRSMRVHENLQAIKSFSKTFPILPCNAGTAEAYGNLHAYLLNKGRPIPDNDIWIAAIAHQRGFTLITRDAHFRHIEFLSILVW